ncbi:membrane-associated protein, putative [Bodo saltans]|uniref:Membrane-associated protein, putative n=1 Tax=Bodo saltans TaxID=75058 RepID=A0A0S4J750_BODSA|nr:membrane-associated protein, putative [Bodo saltans]|eukprot:CUG87297.1 membrane-associated protein, putative [Bodo saltans]
MQTSSSSSRPSRRGNRMHLLQLAETMAKQFRHRQRQDMFSKWKLFVVMKAVGILVQSAAFLSPAQFFFLLQLAETMAKQLRHRQRQDVFSKWKLFVVMKAVGILVQSAAFLSPAQLLSTSTNGGGPLPLTLLIKAGKRATIKKRVVSTTRIFRSSISEVGGTTSTSSAALGQLAHQTLQFNGASPTTSTAVVKPLPLISSTAAVSTLVDALLVPSCMKPNVSGPTTSSPAQQPSTPPMATSPRGSRTSPTLDLTSTPTTSAANAGDGLADFLSGIGACGAINSPVSASDMSLASLVKEVQLLRATVEAQKRTIDMRDRYINELVRRQDTDLSLRDIERDHVLQQAVSKLESSRLTQQQRSRAGSRVLVGAASPLSSVPPAVATSPSSAPLSPPFPQPPAATTAAPPPPPPSSSGGAFHHQTLSQATQTLQQIDGSISSSFDGKTVIPMPPVSPVDSNAAGSGIATTTTGAASSMRLPARSNVTSGGPSQNRSSSNINNNKKRNSVDNAMLLQHQQQQQSSSTSSTPRGAGEQTVDETPTTMSVSNVVAGMSHNATGRTLHQKSSLTSSHPASSMSSSSAASQQQSHSATQKKGDQGDHNPSASPMVVLAAQPQMVSLSISSMLRPAVAHPQQQPHHHVNPPPDHQSATDFVLLSARGVINNANHSGGGGGGSTSQPTSSRKVHALRGTSLLPILSQQQQQQQQALLQGSSTVVGNSSTTTTAAAAKGSSSSQPSAAAQQGK